MIQITSGSYIPQPSWCGLRAFAADICRGRPDVHLVGPENKQVLLDRTACGIVVENALANALRYRSPAAPTIAMHLQLLGASAAADTTLRLLIVNRADPASPPLDPWDSASCRMEGPCPNRLYALSSGLGLFHVAMVARLCGMRAWLWQEEDRVLFRLDVTTRVADAEEPEPDSPAGPAGPAGLFPPEARFLVLDDSAVARRWMASVLQPVLPPGGAVRTFGRDLADVDRFKRAAGAEGDVVIVDQHLDFSGADVLGTDVVEELVAAGYRGLVCMRSANASACDVAKYLASGAHCVLPKEARPKDAVALLSREYWKLMRSQPPPLGTVSSMESLV